MKAIVIAIDLDGILAAVPHQWDQDTPIGEPILGARPFLVRLCDLGFQILVTSRRLAHPGGAEAVKDWLRKFKMPATVYVGPGGLPPADIFLSPDAVPCGPDRVRDPRTEFELAMMAMEPTLKEIRHARHSAVHQLARRTADANFPRLARVGEDPQPDQAAPADPGPP